MAALPKSIIKKYGISKKAWAVFRGSSSRGQTTMARKSFRGRVSAIGKKVYRNRNTTSGLLLTVGSAMAYGAVRAKLSQMTATYLPRFAGQYTDEVVLGGLGFFLSKKGGIVGSFGKAALMIESASIGNQLLAGYLTSNDSNSTISAGNPTFNGWV